MSCLPDFQCGPVSSFGLSLRSPLGLVSAPLCVYLSFPWVFIDKYLFHHLAAKRTRNIPPLLIPEFPTQMVQHSFASPAAVCFSVRALVMSEARSRRAELPKLRGHNAFLSVVCPLGCWDIHLSACRSYRYTPAHSRLQEIACLATEFSLYVFFFKYV